MEIFQHIGHIFVTAGILFTSFLGHHAATFTNALSNRDTAPVPSAQPTIQASNDSSGNFYRATRSITYKDYTINMNVAVPKNGGDVTGKVTGDCDGNITGHYDGDDNGKLTGEADINCHMLFVSIPATTDFSGIFNKETKTAQLQMTFNAASFHKSTPATFSFN